MSTYKVLEYYKNEIIFKEGASGSSAFIIKKGQVEISKLVDGVHSVLHILEPVNIFGEMAIFTEGHKRIASARALQHTELIEINKETFKGYTDKSPDFIWLTLNSLVDRLKRTTQMLTSPIMPIDLQNGITVIFSMMMEHKLTKLKYSSTVTKLAKVFCVEDQQIEDELQELNSSGSINIRIDPIGGKVIRLTLY
ncbi:MAG: cyclic nucleotide-binding domain-containing protein [Nitrospirae bacterium]|nr:cyclic nucleotide-binding domain-containing protein [Nitrospirota bacterium]